jgi:hypothetical protein
MMAFRERHPDARVYDLRYGDFVRDPIGSVEKIYAFFGESLGGEVADQMARHLEANPKDRFGGHRYALEDFHLTGAQLAESFAHYLERFEIEREGAGA